MSDVQSLTPERAVLRERPRDAEGRIELSCGHFLPPSALVVPYLGGELRPRFIVCERCESIAATRATR